MSLIFGYEGSLRERMENDHIDCVSPGEPDYPDKDKLFCKMFDSDMKCLDKQYEPGQTYTETGLDICAPGMMHFCENFIDCMDYYSLVESGYGELSIRPSTFAFVKPSGTIVNHGNKFATNQLTIVKRLDYREVIGSIIKAADPNYIIPIDKKRSALISGPENYVVNKTHMRHAEIFEHGNTTKLVGRGNCQNIYSHGHNFTLMMEGDYSYIFSDGDQATIIVVGDNADIRIHGLYAKVVVIGNNNVISEDSYNGSILMEGVQNSVLIKGNANNIAICSDNPFFMGCSYDDGMESRLNKTCNEWYVFDRNNSQEKQGT